MAADRGARTHHGHLVIIGGGEDRVDDKEVLTRFIELSGGTDSKIVVITAASTIPEKMWETYDQAFGDLGVANRRPVHIGSRAETNSGATASLVAEADGIFMTGGDQKRLLAMIGGSEVDAAMHHALAKRGACIGGTSAGASAMSGHMLADGTVELAPEKGAVNLGAGLGFLQRVIIDQHFSERHRLARLLSVVAQNPYLHGIGIDEDTALIVERGVGIEIIGNGTVTVVDGRNVISNVSDIRNRSTPELIDVRLHLLPAGSRYSVTGEDGAEVPPDPLKYFIDIITQPTATQS
ncbi:MAG: cyanophycinase [Massilia sp.]|nr:cyanophycinase [Massilia sp.]